MSTKTMLYLRTDLAYHDFMSGGSVGHTLGVIQGFIDNNFDVVCVTTCLAPLIKRLPVKDVLFVKKPPLLKYTRWPLGCFIQALMIIKSASRFIKNYHISCLYQRTSILNFSGIVLRWWYQKKLILEYNGSDYWMAKHWNKKHCWKILLPFIYWCEQLNLKQADTIVVVSCQLQKELIKRGINPRKILVNPNAVDPEVFDPELKKIKNFTCVKQL